MPLIGKIREEAIDTLKEAQLINAESGPVELRRLVDKVNRKATKSDKSDLVRTSTYDIFLTFLYLFNSENFSYQETLKYCEEIKKDINGWTFDKDGRKLETVESKTNEDGSLTDWTAVNTMTELGLTPIFVNYSMKLVYIAMYHFLKLKKDLLNPNDMIKKLPLPQRIQWMKGVYKKNNFSTFVEYAQRIVACAEKDHAFRQDVSSKRIKVTKEVLSMIENEQLEELYELPNDWHQYLEPRVLELVYDVVHTNAVKKKLALDETESALLSKRDKSALTTYLYACGFDPYSLDNIEEYEHIPNIIEKLDFLKSLGIPVNNALLIHTDFLLNITDEQLEKMKFLVNSNVLSRTTLSSRLSTISKDFQSILNNYHMLKNIIDFNNIFYSDEILFKDIRKIKKMLSILKEYKLSLNNYIFLLCNFEYLSLYDLIMEKEIPEELFISICKTINPLNTIKRIIIYKSIGEDYSTPTNFLKKDVTNEDKFVCPDSMLDEYIPNVVETHRLNILSGESISSIVNNPIVKQLDQKYRTGNTYIIGGIIISRPKFLRNFESVNGNPDYMVLSLVSNSILNEQEYHVIINELNKHTLKK